MNSFLNKDFPLQTSTAQSFYHNHAKNLQIIEYDCQLNPKLLAESYHFYEYSGFMVNK